MKHEGPSDFDEFAATAWPRLVRTAHMLTGDFHEAEDLVQSTLVKVFARWKHIPRDDVPTYVRRALVNNNISRVRKRRVTLLLMPFLPDTVDRGGSGQQDSVEQRDVLGQALSSLSARQRAVIVLRYFDDLSDPEIATVLDCSLGTVKTHARRGLAALRAHPAFTPSPTGALS
ncbi:SigE family RNA polymerase sigma factor [Streptomyces sp. NPDC058701]|uniref:SigE family RNA polymerase sigma factor n=1 Tax=Streptomyces sp. NPDC058701 TaxID=3346608 RepID=UPI00364E2307